MSETVDDHWKLWFWQTSCICVYPSDSHCLHSTSTDSAYSPVTNDHMYFKLSSDSSETPSPAVSTSGYSSSTESLNSNEENSVSLSSLTTQSPNSLLTHSARSLLTHSAKSLLARSGVSLETQSATSIVSQQARSLLEKKALAQAENQNVPAVIPRPAERRSRKRTASTAKPATRNRRWWVTVRYRPRGKAFCAGERCSVLSVGFLWVDR